MLKAQIYILLSTTRHFEAKLTPPPPPSPSSIDLDKWKDTLKGKKGKDRKREEEEEEEEEDFEEDYLEGSELDSEEEWNAYESRAKNPEFRRTWKYVG